VKSKYVRRLSRIIKRRLKNRAAIVTAIAILLVGGLFIYTTYMQDKRFSVNPSSYSSLLNLIARVESKGNYNAYFGNANNSSIDFTRMSIAEVMDWQSEYVREGNASSAVGRYQIVDRTLKGLVEELNLDPKQPFDQATQDKMAIALIERRGAERYINNELTHEEFAANLAKEWAALPKVIGENPNDSYYASDGLNKSLVSIDEVLSAVKTIAPK
jgi:hypothetical protein